MIVIRDILFINAYSVDSVFRCQVVSADSSVGVVVVGLVLLPWSVVNQLSCVPFAVPNSGQKSI